MQQETDALLKEFEEKENSRKLAEEIEMIVQAYNERKAKRMLSDEQEMDEELIESVEELIETIESDEEPIESDVEEPVAEQESHDNESQGACEWLILHSQTTPSDEGVPSSTEGMPSSTEGVVWLCETSEWQHKEIALDESSHVQQELEEDGQHEDGTYRQRISEPVEEYLYITMYLKDAEIDKINLLEEKLFKATFSVQLLGANDKHAKIFTGLPSWKIFYHLYNFIAPHPGKSISLSLEDELLLTLCCFRLGLRIEDLAVRFFISSTSASRIFNKWIDLLYVRVKFLIKLPSRELCQQNMPMVFKELYPLCISIIDCSEIFIEIPKKYDARYKTYSNYKSHNTAKFFVSITPFSTNSFLCQCWGDGGFTIRDDISVYGAVLKIPAFTRGKKQLPQRDVEMSKKLSQVRIHVERVIGLLKNKYTILQGRIRVNMLKHEDESNGVCNIDKILTVCASLVNLCK
uniref:DDE Tnp4 domain-containing protein n=1 Tax=Amphimedon queenslandica TaxID=400682 RepID=A0A1X7UQV1_AMPQE